MPRLVHVSWMMGDSELIKPLTADIVANSDTNAKAVEAMGLLKHGQPLQRDMLPEKIWFDNDSHEITRLPALFNANGYYVVSSQAAAILTGFDLGAGSLDPVQIYQADRVTPVEGEWFSWTFGNTKNALVAEKSEKLRKFGVSGTRWNMPIANPADAIALDAACSDGPDVWVDPALFKSVFLSGGLSEALHQAGLAKSFRLARCRLV